MLRGALSCLVSPTLMPHPPAGASVSVAGYTFCYIESRVQRCFIQVADGLQVPAVPPYDTDSRCMVAMLLDDPLRRDELAVRSAPPTSI
jgi:hypothetical protein